MKKGIVLSISMMIIISLFTINNALCQDKAPSKSSKKQNSIKDQDKISKKQCNIEGIGIFKIDKTTIDVIKELENEFGTKTDIIYDFKDRYNAKGKYNSIFLIDTSNNRYPGSSLCPETKEYYIPVYKIADMEIRDIKLKFYKDILYEFDCTSTQELFEALKIKYGTPDIKKDTKVVSCLYKYTGNNVALEENTFTSTWTNGNIEAQDVMSNSYNDKCKEIFIRFLSISDNRIVDIEYQCHNKIKQQNESQKNQNRLKELKDF
jgi:hypothetical protein